MQVRVGLATKTKAPFDAKDDNSLEEPKLECAPGTRSIPRLPVVAHGAHPGDAAISRRRPGNQVLPPRTSSFVMSDDFEIRYPDAMMSILGNEAEYQYLRNSCPHYCDDAQSGQGQKSLLRPIQATEALPPWPPQAVPFA
jgi:hypothetical protein